jgi:hypothetical protein
MKTPRSPRGVLLSAHRKEVIAMKQIRLNVAIAIDYRFVLALTFGLAALVAVVLLLTK